MTEGAATGEDRPAPPRAAWVDRAKGYGIILVVIGHVSIVDRLVLDILIFHMPLFFFLSGVTFKPFAGRERALAKVQSMLLPYVAFGLFVTACLLAANLAFGMGLVIPGPLHFLLGGNLLVGAFGTFWFPTALLATLLLLNMLVRMPVRWQAVTLAAMVGGAFLFGDAVAYNPYGLLTVAMALPFAAAGYHVGLHRTLGANWKTILLIVLAVAAFFLLAPHIGRVEYKYLRYGPFPASLIAAAAAIFVTCCVSALRVPGVAAIGRASLTIMYTHLLLFTLLQSVTSWPVIVVVAVLAGFALHRLFEQFAPTRRVFLGMRSESAAR
jgi:fucose 4-O-acetylase-like acetyltransferase